ncbi:MAG: hypothetical protein OCC49_19515 [Fibrobacterales bacterium]
MKAYIALIGILMIQGCLFNNSSSQPFIDNIKIKIEKHHFGTEFGNIRITANIMGENEINKTVYYNNKKLIADSYIREHVVNSIFEHRYIYFTDVDTGRALDTFKIDFQSNSFEHIVSFPEKLLDSLLILEHFNGMDSLVISWPDLSDYYLTSLRLTDKRGITYLPSLREKEESNKYLFNLNSPTGSYSKIVFCVTPINGPYENIYFGEVYLFIQSLWSNTETCKDVYSEDNV